MKLEIESKLIYELETLAKYRWKHLGADLLHFDCTNAKIKV